MNNFFGLINRMKFIERWSLMRNTSPENLMEHSYQVAVIAQALCFIRNTEFGGNVNADKAAAIALYHDTSEVITGDLPTPIKYHNDKIKSAYKELESLAEDRLSDMLPCKLKAMYGALLKPDVISEEYKIVKAADKLSAYIKCVEELNAGNQEFMVAAKSIKLKLDSINNIPEVKYFMDNFLEGYFKPLDVLK